MEEKIKGGSFHPLFSGEAQKKHRPRGSMSTKTVLSVRDQGLEKVAPPKKPVKERSFVHHLGEWLKRWLKIYKRSDYR